MKLVLKIVGAIVGVVVLATAGLATFAHFYLTPEKLRALVEPRLAETLKRPFRLGSLDFSIFSGLKVTDFKVGHRQDQGGGDFIAGRDLVFNYDLWPLLTGRLSIGEVSLAQPTINIFRDRQGKLNFADLTAKPAGPAARPAEGPAGAGMELMISKVRVKDGRVTLKDLATNETLVLSGIDLEARDIAPDRSFPFGVSLSVNGLPVKLSGQVNPATLVGQVNLAADRLELKDLGQLLPAGQRRLAGTLSVNLAADLKGQDKVAAKGQLGVKGLTVSGPGQAKTVENLDVALKFDASADLKTKRADIAALELTLGPNRLSLAGFASPAAVDIKLTAPRQELGLVKAFLAGSPVVYKGGQAELALRVRGQDVSKQAALELTAKLDKLLLGAGGRDYPAMDLDLDVAGGLNLTTMALSLEKFQLTGPGVKVRASGQADPNNINLSLSPLELDLAKVAGLLAPAPGLELAGHVQAELKISGRPSQPAGMAAVGFAQLDRVTAKGPGLPGPLDVSGRLELERQNIKRLELKGKLGETAFTAQGSGQGLFTKPDLVMNLTADQADLEKLLASPQVRVGSPGESAKKKDEGKDRGGEPPAVQVNASAKGRLSVAALKYKFMTLRDFNVTYEFRDNILTLGSITSAVAPAGALAANLRLDLSKPGYDYKGLISLTKAEVAPIAQSFLSKEVGKFTGLGFLEATFSGSGVTFESLRKHLTAKIKTNLTGGTVEGNPQLQEAGKFLGVKGFDNFKYDSLKGDFNVAQGMVDVAGALASACCPVDLKGQVGLDGATKLSPEVRLSPQTAQAGLAKTIMSVAPKDKNGFHVVPLSITGPIGDLKVGLDEAKLATHAVDKVKEAAGDVLKGLLPMGPSAPGGAKTEQKK